MNTAHAPDHAKRKRYGTPPPKPMYPVETEAAQFLRAQRYQEECWNTREARAFGFFIDYLRRLQFQSVSQLDVPFINALRHNVIQTYFEGALNNLFLSLVSSGIDQFIEQKADASLTPLFYEEEIYDLIQERKNFSVFSHDAFEDVLSDLRYHNLHTEAALLEVVRYLGLTLKEAMLLNPSLSIDYARKHEHIVVRNQDGATARRVPIWNVEQMTALTRLASNRLLHDPEEQYKNKRFAYLFAPLTQVGKHLTSYDLSLYSLRKAYFEDEFYSQAHPDMDSGEISTLAFSVSRGMGHQFCFDDSMMVRTGLDPRMIASASSILAQHPRKFFVPETVAQYISDHNSNRADAEGDGDDLGEAQSD